MKTSNSVFTAISNECSLIAGGTIVPLDTGPFTIGIPTLTGDEHVRVKISIERDDEDKKSRSELRGDSVDGKLIHLRIVNLESPLGGGPDKPLALWKSETHQIFLQLRIYTQGSSPPTVHFSFYSKQLEEKS